MLVKKDKKDRFKPDASSVLARNPKNYTYFGSGEVDYYFDKYKELIYLNKNGGLIHMVNIRLSKVDPKHIEAIKIFNKLKLLT